MTKPAVSYDSSQTDIRIRDCTVADSPVIADIYNAYIRQGGATMDTREKSTADMERQIQGFDERETILIMERGSKVLGWGIIKRYSDRVGYRVCCETSVYLRIDELRKGLGTRMKLALIERCKQYGYHHLVAKIFAENEASIEYNRRLGYEVVGRQNQIGYLKGEWKDIVIMQLILSDVPPYRPDLA